MKALVLLVVFVLAACGTNGAVDTDARTISVWHDDERSVTCWVYKSGYAGGLSCIPDKELAR